jgi:hypothetical protein
MKKGVLFLAPFLFFGVFSFCQAAADLDVVINEVAWMGTEVSYNDEWTVSTKQRILLAYL